MDHCYLNSKIHNTLYGDTVQMLRTTWSAHLWMDHLHLQL